MKYSLYDLGIQYIKTVRILHNFYKTKKYLYFFSSHYIYILYELGPLLLNSSLILDQTDNLNGKFFTLDSTLYTNPLVFISYCRHTESSEAQTGIFIVLLDENSEISAHSRWEQSLSFDWFKAFDWIGGRPKSNFLCKKTYYLSCRRIII